MKTKLLLLLAVLMTAFSVNAQVTSVALVGEAAGGWPGDPGNPGPVDILQMTSTDGENWTLNAVTLTGATLGGGVKFRANNDWTINWGNAAFPSGTGTQNGANILCIAGTYDVTFNSTTGIYNFSGGAPIPVVKLVGSAVSDPAGLTLTTTDLTTFSISNATLLDGMAQFEVDGELYGGLTFPTGTADNPASMIPVTAGSYTTVTFNYGTGDYEFTAAPVYPSIAIVGDGAGGWPTGAPGEIDVNQMTTTDGVIYTIDNLTLTTGSVKFRANNMWTDSWGSTEWPSGVATLNGPDNIPSVAGTYSVTFNRTTLEYNFSVPSVAIVGAGTLSGWPTGNAGEIDPNVMSTVDGINYTLTAIELTTNPIKFRQNNSWSVNWGGTAWPNGVAELNSPDNIPAVAGIYDVTFNKQTLEFNFTPNLATTSFTKSNFKAFPNPTNNNWNFTSTKDVIISIQVIDMLGKVVVTSSSTTIDATALTTGVYFAKVATATATETIKVVKN